MPIPYELGFSKTATHPPLLSPRDAIEYILQHGTDSESHAVIRGVQQSSSDLADRYEHEDYYWGHLADEVPMDPAPPTPPVACSTPTTSKRPGSTITPPPPKRLATPANTHARPTTTAPAIRDEIVLDADDPEPEDFGVAPGLTAADIARVMRHATGEVADDTQPAYRQLGSASRRLAVVEVSGLAGADAPKLVHDLNRMFVHHNIDDMWEVISSRCSITSHFDAATTSLIVDETSLLEVMGGRATARFQLTHSRHTVTLTPRPAQKAVLKVYTSSPAAPGRTVRGAPNASRRSIAASNASTRMHPGLTYLPIYPYTPTNPFFSLWGFGFSATGAEGQAILFPDITLYAPPENQPPRASLDRDDALLHHGMWVATGTTEKYGTPTTATMTYPSTVWGPVGTSGEGLKAFFSKENTSSIKVPISTKKSPHGPLLTDLPSPPWYRDTKGARHPEWAFLEKHALVTGAEWQCSPHLFDTQTTTTFGRKNLSSHEQLVLRSCPTGTTSPGSSESGEYTYHGTTFSFSVDSQFSSRNGWVRFPCDPDSPEVSWGSTVGTLLRTLYSLSHARPFPDSSRQTSSSRIFPSFSPSRPSGKCHHYVCSWATQWAQFIEYPGSPMDLLDMETQCHVVTIEGHRVFYARTPFLDFPPEEESVHVSGPWVGQRKVMSLSAPKKTSITITFDNAQSLTPHKFDIVKGRTQYFSVDVVCLCEIWGDKPFDISIPQYRRRFSRIRHQGAGMGILVKKAHSTPLIVLLDTRHVFVVSFTFRGQPILIYCVHLPQRNRGSAYTHVLSELSSLEVENGDPYRIMLGDFNRHAPTHVETQGFLSKLHMQVVIQGTEGRLHKDWVAVDESRSCLHRVLYELPIADHPCILGHFVFLAGSTSGKSDSYRPVSVSCWDTEERIHFANLLEVLSPICQTLSIWMFWYRESMGAIEAVRRTNLSESRTIKGLMRLSGEMSTTHPDDNSSLWDSQAADLKWQGMIANREILSRPSLTGEASSILKYKKTLPFVSLSKVWDSTTQRVVSGPDILEVIRREAALRHPPAPNPLPADWVRNHCGPFLASPFTEEYSKLELARRLRIHRTSSGAILNGVGYVVSISELLESIRLFSSPTATMDWFVPSLISRFGLFSLRRFGELMITPALELPLGSNMSPHLPLAKCPGTVLNVCTRPILVESGVHRCRQKVWLSRIQHLLSSRHFCHFQHAVYKGSSCVGLRRLIYCIILQHRREGRELVLLKTDQSNAYGQTDLDGLAHQGLPDPVLHWALQQSLVLYSLIQIFVTTAYGLTPPYFLGGGLIQGGGMDPFWYVLYTVLVSRALSATAPGVPVRCLDRTEMVSAQATVDDTILLSPSVPQMRSDAEAAIVAIERCNGRCNPDKYGLVHYVPTPCGFDVGRIGLSLRGCAIPSSTRKKYVRLVGGNINVLSPATEDQNEMRAGATGLSRRLKQQIPSIRMLRMLVDGVLTMRWVYRKLVDWPLDVLSNATYRKGEVTCAVSSVANVIRLCLHLPLQTPRQFIFGGSLTGCLGIPHPAWKLWVASVCELIKNAQSPHPLVRGAVQYELFRPIPSTENPSSPCDFSILRTWMTRVQWSVHRAPTGTDGWTLELPVLEPCPSFVIAVCDCSVDPSNPEVWGLGGVVATPTGRVLATVRSTLYCRYASTTLLELTGVTELLRATRRALAAAGLEHVVVWPWCDNKGAVDLANTRDLSNRPPGIMTFLLASLEVLYSECPFFVGWCPAQHDTECGGLLSTLNKQADSLARLGRLQENSPLWALPDCWHEPTAIYFRGEGKFLIANVKMALSRTYNWECLPPHGREHKLPFPFWEVWKVPATLTHLWVHNLNLHPRQAARVLLTAQYLSWSDLFVGSEGEGVCNSCASPYYNGEAHRWRDCPAAALTGYLCLVQSVFTHVSMFRDGVSIELCWGGVELRRGPTVVVLQWCNPIYIGPIAADLRQEQGWVPFALGLFPSREGARRIRSLLTVPLVHFFTALGHDACHKIVHMAPRITPGELVGTLFPWGLCQKFSLGCDPRVYDDPRSSHDTVLNQYPFLLAYCLVSLVPPRFAIHCVAVGGCARGSMTIHPYSHAGARHCVFSYPPEFRGFLATRVGGPGLRVGVCRGRISYTQRLALETGGCDCHTVYFDGQYYSVCVYDGSDSFPTRWRHILTHFCASH